MNENLCMARLLASAVHDMRNILAIVRESTGLAQDIAALAAKQTGSEGEGRQSARETRIAASLTEVQRAVQQGAALSDAMDYMAHAGGADGRDTSGPCDLTRACRSFELLAARQARGAQMQLDSGETEEPVWINVPVLTVLRSLLEVFDLCAAVGGQVALRFTAGRRQKEEGIVVDVLDGPNRELVLAALTSAPMLATMPPGWRAALMPWRDTGSRYFLSIVACETDNQ